MGCYGAVSYTHLDDLKKLIIASIDASKKMEEEQKSKDLEEREKEE